MLQLKSPLQPSAQKEYCCEYVAVSGKYVQICTRNFIRIWCQCCQRAELKTSRARARLGLTKPSRDFGSPSRARAEPSLPLEMNEPSRAYIPQLGHKPSRAEPMSRLGSGLGEPSSAGSVKC